MYLFLYHKFTQKEDNPWSIYLKLILEIVYLSTAPLNIYI